MTIFSKNLRPWPSGSPPAYAYAQ